MPSRSIKVEKNKEITKSAFFHKWIFFINL